MPFYDTLFGAHSFGFEVDLTLFSSSCIYAPAETLFTLGDRVKFAIHKSKCVLFDASYVVLSVMTDKGSAIQKTILSDSSRNAKQNYSAKSAKR